MFRLSFLLFLHHLQSTGIKNTGGNAIVRGEAESMAKMLAKRSEVHIRKVIRRIFRKFS